MGTTPITAVNYRASAEALRGLAAGIDIEQARQDALHVAKEWDRLVAQAERAVNDPGRSKPSKPS